MTPVSRNSPREWTLGVCPTPCLGTLYSSLIVSSSLEEPSFQMSNQSSERIENLPKVTSRKQSPARARLRRLQSGLPPPPGTPNSQDTCKTNGPAKSSHHHSLALLQVLYFLHDIQCGLHNNCVRWASSFLFHQ